MIEAGHFCARCVPSCRTEAIVATVRALEGSSGNALLIRWGIPFGLRVEACLLRTSSHASFGAEAVIATIGALEVSSRCALER